MTCTRPEPGFVIAATGLVTEARIAARAGRVRAVAGGGDSARLSALIEEAIAEGGRGIISFGIAGGLAGGLEPGTCVVASEVVHGNERYRADEVWATRLAERRAILEPERFGNERPSWLFPSPWRGRVRGGGGHQTELYRIAGVGQPVVTPSEKRALAAATGAAAVDMESHIVARIAARHGLPFAVLRVVADPLDHNLPPAALVAMRPDGTTDVGACLRSLARQPGQLPALVRVAFDTRRAMAALLRCVELLGPGLGLRDLG